jgi:hypothetical protein
MEESSLVQIPESELLELGLLELELVQQVLALILALVQAQVHPKELVLGLLGSELLESELPELELEWELLESE